MTPPRPPDMPTNLLTNCAMTLFIWLMSDAVQYLMTGRADGWEEQD